MKLKHGVSIAGSQPEIITARKIADVLWQEHGQELVVTAGTETPEKHMEGSKHAEGLADDYRVRYFDKPTRIIVVGKFKMRLRFVSKYYQVILHARHMHVEYDEK